MIAGLFKAARIGGKKRRECLEASIKQGDQQRLSDTARAAGGLQVILTELHGNSRIDRQLCGRCGRQGDPGVVHRVLSLQDEIVARRKAEKAEKLAMA